MEESTFVLRTIPLILGGLLWSVGFYLIGELGKSITTPDKIGLGYIGVTGFLLLSSVVIDILSLKGWSILRLIGVGMFVGLLSIHGWIVWKGRSARPR